MTAENENNRDLATTLQVFSGDRCVFSSTGRWLHPLFELEGFLSAAGLETPDLELRDKIIGKAAAFLIIRMGFRNVHAGLLSRLAQGVFEQHGVHYGYDQLVERIDCMTESLLAEVDDSQTAYRIVRQRAEKADGATPAVPRRD